LYFKTILWLYTYFQAFEVRFSTNFLPRLTDPDRATHQRATESAKLVGGEHAVRTTIRCRYGDFTDFEAFLNLVPLPLSYRGRVFLWGNLGGWRVFVYPLQVCDPPGRETGAPRRKKIVNFYQKTVFHQFQRLHFCF